MELIDIDLYLGNWPFAPEVRCEPGQLEKALQRAGIKKGLVAPLESLFITDNLRVNKKFFKRLSPFSGTLLPLLVLNPMLPLWKETFRFFSDRASGFKLFFRFHQYSLLDPKLEDFYAELAQKNKPVIISLHLIDERTAPVYLNFLPEVKVETLIELADRYPGINFIFSSPTGAEANELLLAKRENIFITTSFLEGEGLLEKFAGSPYRSKILFGSNYPFFYLEAARVKLDTNGFSVETKEIIGQGNVEKIFYIPKTLSLCCSQVE